MECKLVLMLVKWVGHGQFDQGLEIFSVKLGQAKDQWVGPQYKFT